MPLSHSEAIIHSLFTHVLILDRQLHIQFINAAAEQLFAQNAKKLIGNYFPNLFESLSLNIALMQSALSKGIVFSDNEIFCLIHGQHYTLSLTAQLLPDNQQILVEISSLNSHKKISQEQLQQAQQNAAQALVRSLAHEIKNPLGGLRGAAQLLAKALPDEKFKDYTTLIIEQADRLRNLVDRLLGPQHILQQEKQNIHKAIEKSYALTYLEKPPNIEIVRDYDPSLPELKHDTEQLEQVVLNIIRNAMQAIGENKGLIQLRTRTAHQVTMHGHRYRLCARIDIEDNGPGIPIALHDTLFYPTVSNHKNGSGIGLSISRRIIDQHHGKIEFNSVPNCTIFSIYLPIS